MTMPTATATVNGTLPVVSGTPSVSWTGGSSTFTGGAVGGKVVGMGVGVFAAGVAVLMV